MRDTTTVHTAHLRVVPCPPACGHGSSTYNHYMTGGRRVPDATSSRHAGQGMPGDAAGRVCRTASGVPAAASGAQALHRPGRVHFDVVRGALQQLMAEVRHRP